MVLVLDVAVLLVLLEEEVGMTKIFLSSIKTMFFSWCLQKDWGLPKELENSSSEPTSCSGFSSSLFAVQSAGIEWAFWQPSMETADGGGGTAEC